jgi:hypothetical protein
VSWKYADVSEVRTAPPSFVTSKFISVFLFTFFFFVQGTRPEIEGAYDPTYSRRRNVKIKTEINFDVRKDGGQYAPLKRRSSHGARSHKAVNLLHVSLAIAQLLSKLCYVKTRTRPLVNYDKHV